MFSANVFSNIRIEIATYAKQINSNFKVKQLSLSNDKEQLNKFNEELQSAITIGDWVVIENAHVLNDWSKETLNILFVNYICLFLY